MIEVNYLVLKMLHIFGAVLFLGNVLVTASWKVMADRTRDPKIVAFGQRLLNVTDFVFSSAGVSILLITGLFMGQTITESILEVRWLAWGLWLMLASVGLWMLILLPVQAKQGLLVREADGKDVPKLYWILGRVWITFGVLAVGLPLMNLYFMVFKPT